jgi:hypothetical protein
MSGFGAGGYVATSSTVSTGALGTGTSTAKVERSNSQQRHNLLSCQSCYCWTRRSRRINCWAIMKVKYRIDL